RFQHPTRLPMPPVERLGRGRLPAHQNRVLRHIKRFRIPTLILIELPQITPSKGGGPTVVKLISNPSRGMKRLIGRECELFVEFAEEDAQLGIRQPNRDERADLFVRGLKSG